MKRYGKTKYHAKDVREQQKSNRLQHVTANRTYKNTIFQMLFHQKKELLELYNGLNRSHYTNEGDLKIVTLENAVYMSMKNDLAFVLDMRLHMYEHQSTHNPNIPLRDLFYVSQEYQSLVDKKTLYGVRAVKIPAPRFVVFYNGTRKQPERQWMKLSDLYELPEENPMLELQVLVLNINRGNNEELTEKCKTLKEYMLYIERIRYYVDIEKRSLQDAVETAVDECIKEGILVDFLRKNKAEAIAVSIFEYDEEKEIKLLRESEREYGRDEERAANIRKMVQKINVTTEQAMDILDIPQKERRDVMDIYRQNLEAENTESIFEYDEEKEIRLLKEAERDVEKIENIKLIMKNLNLTAEQAMDALEIPAEKRKEYFCVRKRVNDCE